MPATQPDRPELTVHFAAGDWAKDLIWRKAKDGELRLVESWQNVLLTLRHQPAWTGVLGWNEFANRIEIRKPPGTGEALAHVFRPGPWTEEHELEFGLWLAQQRLMVIKAESDLRRGIVGAARAAKFHPVREWLGGLEWDGRHRLKLWLSEYLNVPASVYSILVGRYFLLGMIARVFDPGCIMRHVLVLEGTQWRGKSTALRMLAQPWFAETPFVVGDKDALLALQGVWLYEIAELDAFSRAEFRAVKAFISNRTDRFRAPYTREVGDFDRQTVFAGTTNQSIWGRDPTGGTRFWPVTAPEARINELAADRDQLFAEAMRLYRWGMRRVPPRAIDARYFVPEQQARDQVDPWTEPVYEYLCKLPTHDEYDERLRKSVMRPARITVTAVLTDCLKFELSRIDGSRQAEMRVGQILRGFDWVRRRSTAGARSYFYEAPWLAWPQPIAGQGEAEVGR